MEGVYVNVLGKLGDGFRDTTYLCPPKAHYLTDIDLHPRHDTRYLGLLYVIYNMYTFSTS
jgi:hypothetical protein